MSEEFLKAVPLRGYQFFRDPNSATRAVLRLDTESGQHWFLVTRKTLKMLSEICAKHADELQELQ